MTLLTLLHRAHQLVARASDATPELHGRLSDLDVAILLRSVIMIRPA